MIALIKFQCYGEKKKTYDWEGEVQEDRDVGGGRKVWILTRSTEHFQEFFNFKKTVKGKK